MQRLASLTQPRKCRHSSPTQGFRAHRARPASWTLNIILPIDLTCSRKTEAAVESAITSRESLWGDARVNAPVARRRRAHCLSGVSERCEDSGPRRLSLGAVFVRVASGRRVAVRAPARRSHCASRVGASAAGRWGQEVLRGTARAGKRDSSGPLARVRPTRGCCGGQGRSVLPCRSRQVGCCCGSVGRLGNSQRRARAPGAPRWPARWVCVRGRLRRGDPPNSRSSSRFNNSYSSRRELILRPVPACLVALARPLPHH